MSADALLASIAARQLGLVTRRDLLAAGLADHHAWHSRAGGRFVSVHPGVYRAAAVPVSWEQQVLAACLALGPHAVASHRTAGHLYGLLPARPPVIDVLVPVGNKGQVAGARLHRSRQLEESDRAAAGPLRLTSAVRTVIDLAACLHPAHLDDVLGRGLTLRLFGAKEVLVRLDQLGARGFKGAAALRLLLDERIDDPCTESEMERKVLRLMRAHGLPEPDAQCEVRDGAGTVLARCDLAYPQALLAIEYDGREAHLHEAAFDQDRHRDAQLASLGWQTLRVTKRIMRDPDAFLAAVRHRLNSMAVAP